jgi:phosphoesterase RecJ-like protein
MTNKFLDLLGRHEYFILTTHDPADADGIGAQMVLTSILRRRGKQPRIINASPIPTQFRFMDPLGQIEEWDAERHGALPKQSAMIIVDTADEYTIGSMKDAYFSAREVFVVDHHEPKPNAIFSGICDASSASASELAVELAVSMGITLDVQTAFAAYSGIVYDTGFFAYPKTSPQTFRAALALIEMGADPGEAHNSISQNASAQSLLLQQKAVLGMTLHCQGKVAVQVLLPQDFVETGASSEDTDGFANFPLRSREVVVSLMVKEATEKKVRCSLRSKGAINVAKIAQEFGGGGHVNAAGFKSDLTVAQTVDRALASIAACLENQQ